MRAGTTERDASGEPALVQPARVRAARSLRGLTQSEAVGRMSHPISAAALSQIEAGKVRPTRDTLAELARALEVPPAFFSAPWPTGNEHQPVTFFRDLRATPMRERHRATARAVLLQDLLSVIGHHVQLPKFDVPEWPIDNTADFDAIADVAAAVRREWGLGTGPISHVIHVLERHGIPVVRTSMGHHKTDGYVVNFGQRSIVVLATDKHSYVRSRFDASHELGHLVLHRGAEPGSKVVERQAHDFASAFLLPTDAALRELPVGYGGGFWGRLAQMKQKWGISIAALVVRAKVARRISPDEYRLAMRYMSAKGWRKAEPGDQELGPPEAPTMVQQAVNLIEGTGVSLPALLERSAVPAADALDLIQAASDRRPMLNL